MRSLFLGSLLSLLLSSPMILADPSVVVLLNSGAEYHGQIVERVPGDHITIQLITGEVKVFAWRDVASDSSTDHSSPPPVPSQSTPPPIQAVQAQDTSQLAFVHIDNRDPYDRVELMHEAVTTEKTDQLRVSGKAYALLRATGGLAPANITLVAEA